MTVAMRILMIAPQPFFEPRGTPFSEFHRIRALTDLGHTVDLVTYPFGRDVALPGLRVFRCARPPFVRGVKVGPSWAKLPLDALLTWRAWRLARHGGYGAVHSHEEGAAIGVVLARLLGVPHLYDMHSSLPQQLHNFAFSRSRLLAALFRLFERQVIRRSRVVIVICPQLEEVARSIRPDARIVLIENAPGAAESAGGGGAAVRASLGLGSDVPVVLYAGTFEAYQGLDLLFAAHARVVRAVPRARLVLAGGKPEQVVRAREGARAAGVEESVVFAGEQPSEVIPAFLDAADVLVSPRSRGTNTPLKIYQYLRAGRPVVATRLLTHTQVLNDEVAVLTEPTPQAFGDGIVLALTDRERAAALGAAARSLAENKYSYTVYLERTRRAYALLAADGEPEAAGAVA